MSIRRLTQACRNKSENNTVEFLPLKPVGRQRPSATSPTFQAFCLSALALPGMLHSVLADDSEDEIGTQFSHYEQSPYSFTAPITSTTSANGNVVYSPVTHIKNNLKPLSVDGNQFFAKIHLDDRWRLFVGHEEDVWSGATPLLSEPVNMGGNDTANLSSASFFAINTDYGTLYNPQGKVVDVIKTNSATGAMLATAPDPRSKQIISFASPEVRDQLDAKLGYDWDNASLDVGAGTSVEHDYLSRFINSALRLDFNQKRTSVNFAFSYAGSAIKAHPMTLMSPAPMYEFYNNPSYLPAWYSLQQGGWQSGAGTITGGRSDTSLSLALSQVVNKNDVFSAGFSYTNTSGYQANPYKGVEISAVDPNWTTDGYAISQGITVGPGMKGTAISIPVGVPWYMENRPRHRNQFTLNSGYLHYMEGWDAAWKINYSFFHDDWNITAHTFDAEWRQDLGGGWMLTPSARYYSQSQAFFFADYFTMQAPGTCTICDGSDTYNNLNPASIPNFYSSDQRLSAYGALSGGLSLTKRFIKGLTMEFGYQYYDHAGGLKLGGGGEGSFMDFQYYVASAGLRANLGQLSSARLFDGDMPFGGLANTLAGLFSDSEAGGQTHYAHMQHGAHQHSHIPAGVMWAHMLDQEDQFMFGYRYMRSTQGSSYLNGSQPVTSNQVLAQGCSQLSKGKRCTMINTDMQMDMHMLDLMYAPTSWLTLMLMPTYMDMSMDMYMQTMSNMGAGFNMHGMDMRPVQYNGGFGDTGSYAMFRLWDGYGQHLHLTQGLSFPTGTIRSNFEYTVTGYYPYDMQNGSGTVDYKPSLTYTGMYSDAFWGTQVSGTHRLTTNNGLGWSLGDNMQFTAWLGYQLTDWWSATVRGQYTKQDKIIGSYNNNGKTTLAALGSLSWGYMPDQSTSNYGGGYGDVGFGLTMTVPHGTLAGNTVSFEWLQPVYTYVDGYQLDRTGALAASWGLSF